MVDGSIPSQGVFFSFHFNAGQSACVCARYINSFVSYCLVLRRIHVDLSAINYSPKDVTREIHIPKYLDEELAFIIGIHLGDGNITLDPRKYTYSVNYTGHLYDESDWYFHFILPLFQRMFNITFSVYIDRRPKR